MGETIFRFSARSLNLHPQVKKFYSFRMQSAQTQQTQMQTNQMQPMHGQTMGVGPQRQMMVVTTPMEPYIGPVTIAICLVTGWCCVLCCPCDERPGVTTVIQQPMVMQQQPMVMQQPMTQKK